jgi:hypothetical protein
MRALLYAMRKLSFLRWGLYGELMLAGMKYRFPLSLYRSNTVSTKSVGQSYRYNLRVNGHDIMIMCSFYAKGRYKNISVCAGVWIQGILSGSIYVNGSQVNHQFTFVLKQFSLHLYWLRNSTVQLFRTDKAKNVDCTKMSGHGGRIVIAASLHKNGLKQNGSPGSSGAAVILG